MEINDKIDIERIDAKISEARLRLWQGRDKSGLSQTEAAEAAGLSQPLISAFESGSRNISLKDLLILCQLYGLDVSYVFDEKPAEPESLAISKYLERGLSIEQELSAPVKGISKGIAETFLALNVYKVIRLLYMQNPHHSGTRLFNVSVQQLEKAIAKSTDDLENKLTGLIALHPASAKKIDPCEQSLAALRDFIKEIEDIILACDNYNTNQTVLQEK